MTARFSFYLFLILFLCLFPARSESDSPASRYFAVEVIDDQTGRGVPLVELRSTVSYYTDSAGLVAIDDPSLMDRKVFFTITSHGYEYPADGLGCHGTCVLVKPGGYVRLKIKRLHIAERLYRITGEGIYDDSVRLGRAVPIDHPLLNAEVTGQDSEQSVVYHDKIYSFWGDTLRLRYPLGHFGTSGAVALLPGKGGLDPSQGINFTYFSDEEGFSRPMVPQAPRLLRWIDALTVILDGGRENLVCRGLYLKSLGEGIQCQLLIYNDAKNVFDTLSEVPLDAPIQPINHTFPVKTAGLEYIYCGQEFPNIRFQPDLAHFRDLASYEGFTCLKPGCRYDKTATQLDRDRAGKLIWGWKANTHPLGRLEMAELVKAGKIKGGEEWFRPLDVVTKRPITIANSSVSYNEFRHKYIAICGEVGGTTSNLGEIWYSEADKPEGPWPYARKVLSHDHYSFYNPVHDTYFDQNGGRTIYFQGTYSVTFSGDNRTPRYEYNQIMYRLNLSDPRLKFLTATAS